MEQLQQGGISKRSTVWKYKQLYEKEVSACAKSDDFSDITALPLKKQGRPLALGESLDNQIQKYVCALQLAGTPVSCSLYLAAAEGIIVSKDRTVLTENGGYGALTRGWALFFCSDWPMSTEKPGNFPMNSLKTYVVLTRFVSEQPAKDHLKQKFHKYTEMADQIYAGKSPDKV